MSAYTRVFLHSQDPKGEFLLRFGNHTALIQDLESGFAQL
jgi:hypothetical protein